MKSGFLYSLTAGVEAKGASEGLHLVREHLAPRIHATGLFPSYRVCRLIQEGDEGETWSFQFFCRTRADFEGYRSRHQGEIMLDFEKRLSGAKVFLFESFLEILEEA